jgi:hypothetical protein
MTLNLPLYVIHTEKNTSASVLQKDSLLREKVTNYLNVEHFNEHDISYDMYLEHFHANILEASYRIKNAKQPYVYFADYQLSTHDVSKCLKYKWALGHFWQSNLPACLIIQNHAVLSKDFVDSLNNAIGKLPPNWQVADISQQITTDITHDNTNITWQQQSHLKHIPGLIWSRAAAGILLAAWQNYKICMQIENELGFWFKQAGITSYNLSYPLLSQYVVSTPIDQKI